MPYQGALLTRLVAKLREGGAQRTTPVKGAVREMMRTLRRDGTVGLLLDQWTEPSRGGTVIDFLGVPTCMSNVTGLLTQRTGVPIYIVCCTGSSAGRYVMRLVETIEPGAGQSAEALTQLVADALGRIIRRFPGQWLWMYRRWKRRVPGYDAGIFPFYAKEMGEKEQAAVVAATRDANLVERAK